MGSLRGGDIGVQRDWEGSDQQHLAQASLRQVLQNRVDCVSPDAVIVRCQTRSSRRTLKRQSDFDDRVGAFLKLNRATGVTGSKPFAPVAADALNAGRSGMARKETPGRPDR